MVWAIDIEDLVVAAGKDGNYVSSQQSSDQPIIIFKDLAIMFLEIDDQTSNYDVVLTESAQQLVQQVEGILTMSDYLFAYLEANGYTLNKAATWAFDAIASEETELAIDQFGVDADRLLEPLEDITLVVRVIQITASDVGALEALPMVVETLKWFNQKWAQLNADVIEFLDLSPALEGFLYINVGNLSDNAILEKITTENRDL